MLTPPQVVLIFSVVVAVFPPPAVTGFVPKVADAPVGNADVVSVAVWPVGPVHVTVGA